MKKLIFLLLGFSLLTSAGIAQEITPSATVVLKKAYVKAAKENKNVLLMFHASWCGWCKKMDKSINDPACKKYFEENYVICYLTVDEAEDKKNLENPGASDFRNKYGGEKQGLPFWVVLDKTGKLLANSKTATSRDIQPANVGCPASEEEVAYFTEVLKKTSKLTDEELAVINAKFRLNEIKAL